MRFERPTTSIGAQLEQPPPQGLDPILDLPQRRPVVHLLVGVNAIQQLPPLLLQRQEPRAQTLGLFRRFTGFGHVFGGKVLVRRTARLALHRMNPFLRNGMTGRQGSDLRIAVARVGKAPLFVGPLGRP
jgi:hypothetical protein